MMALKGLCVAATLLLVAPSASSGTEALEESECEEHPVNKDVVQQLVAYTGATLSLVQDIKASFTPHSPHLPLADGSVRRDLLAELLLALFNKLEAEQTRHTLELERLSQQVNTAVGSRQVVDEILQSRQHQLPLSPQLQLLQSPQPLQVKSPQPLPVKSPHRQDANCNSSADRPVDCHDLLQAGYNQSGVYQLFPYRCEREEEEVRAWCDLEGEGSGWTVVLARRKVPEQVNFNRGWPEYREGFGDPQTEYWIGNRVLHEVTSRRPQVLRVELEDWDGQSRWAEYQSFLVEEEDSLFRLHLSQYIGDAGDAMKSHDNMYFTTSDRDNDSNNGGNCAVSFHGGFWYHRCHTASPTSLFLEKQKSTNGLTWNTWYSDRTTLKAVTFKIRPKTCST